MATFEDYTALVLGRRLRRSEQVRPFFIVGSGRCGSTLLRAILDAHPDVHIPPETFVLGGLVQDFRLFSRLPWTVLLRVVLARIEYHNQFHHFGIGLGELYRRLQFAPPEQRTLAHVVNSFFMYHAEHVKPGASRWGDKTPLNVFALKELNALFPDGTVVHLVRDARDVVSSFLKAGLIKDVDSAAKRWVESVGAARRFGSRFPDRYYELRYEDLVSTPEVEIRHLCARLGLSFEESLLQHDKVSHNLGDVPNLQHLWKAVTPISADRVGKWDRTLVSDSDISRLRRQLEPTMESIGYAWDPVTST